MTLAEIKFEPSKLLVLLAERQVSLSKFGGIVSLLTLEEIKNIEVVSNEVGV